MNVCDVTECSRALGGCRRSGLGRRDKVGVVKRDERRLELAPSEIDHERPDLHELAGDLRQAGDLRHEVVLVEPVRTRFGVDLRVGLRPYTSMINAKPFGSR